MATTTPNFGWPVPTSSDLVKNGATAIEGLGDAIDASLLDLKGGTTGQLLAKATGTDMDFTWTTPTDQTPLTTKGDLFTFTTVDARLGVGTNGQFLTADSTAATGLAWTTGATEANWTTYTPTITAEAGSPTSVTSQAGRYQMLNSKTCLAQAVWRVVDKGTAVGETYFTLPFTTKNVSTSAVGVVRETESSGNMGWADARANQNYARTSQYAMGTWWVNNFTLRAQIVFEVA